MRWGFSFRVANTRSRRLFGHSVCHCLSALTTIGRGEYRVCQLSTSAAPCAPRHRRVAVHDHTRLKIDIGPPQAAQFALPHSGEDRSYYKGTPLRHGVVDQGIASAKAAYSSPRAGDRMNVTAWGLPSSSNHHPQRNRPHASRQQLRPHPGPQPGPHPGPPGPQRSRPQRSRQQRRPHPHCTSVILSKPALAAAGSGRMGAAWVVTDPPAKMRPAIPIANMRSKSLGGMRR